MLDFFYLKKISSIKALSLLIFLAILAISPLAIAALNRNFTTHLVGEQENPQYKPPLKEKQSFI
jgi:hypothetical protein